MRTFTIFPFLITMSAGCWPPATAKSLLSIPLLPSSFFRFSPALFEQGATKKILSSPQRENRLGERFHCIAFMQKSAKFDCRSSFDDPALPKLFARQVDVIAPHNPEFIGVDLNARKE